MIEFKQGLRVKLKADSTYTPRPNNPSIGSEYECVGTISRVAGKYVFVDWDNKTRNSYNGPIDLVQINGFIDLWGDI